MSIDFRQDGTASASASASRHRLIRKSIEVPVVKHGTERAVEDEQLVHDAHVALLRAGDRSGGAQRDLDL
jgi:hypothetical protein